MANIPIGPQSEMVVRKALKQMRKDHKILHFKRESRPGSDFTVTLPNEERILLEVKSSVIGMEKHLKRYPHIPVVVTGHCSTNTIRRGDHYVIKRKAFRRLLRRARLQIEDILRFERDNRAIVLRWLSS